MKKLIPILIIALIGGLGYYQFYKSQHPDPVVLTNKAVTPVQNNTTDGTTIVALQGGDIAKANADRNTVNIQLEPVINGVRKGVVEVGASGFNSFAVDIDQNKNWEMVS